MIVYAPRFVKIITGDFARAITLYPFVFVKKSKDLENQVMLNHEKIHLRQQRELLILPFYAQYLWEYTRHRLRGMSQYQAYRQISFEREAFANERDMEYLNKRKKKAYRDYLT